MKVIMKLKNYVQTPIAFLTVVFAIALALPATAQTVDKQLYLSDPSPTSLTGSLDRIDPADPNNLDNTTTSTATLFKNIANVETPSSTNGHGGGGAVSPLIISNHTTGTNTNRLMMVSVAYDPDNGTSITSVTYTVEGLRNRLQNVEVLLMVP